jgi:hypothetical protein
MPARVIGDLVTEDSPVPYAELYPIVDRILEETEDDPEALARALDHLSPALREELLLSDFLNAYQVFYYYFREDPGDLERDRLILEPASALLTGVLITELEFYELIFRVDSGEPVISVHAGPEVIANFRGTGAYRTALRFLEDTL